MPRPGITSEQVYHAAEALTQEGVAPTVHTVRERLGTGSFSTIATFLNAWRADREAAQAARIPDPPEAVARLFRDVWKASWRANHEALGNERLALDAAKREMSTERAEMSREIEALETALEKAEAATAAKAAELDRAREETTRLATRLDEGGKALEALRAELAAERDARARAGEQAARLETAVEHLESQLQTERTRAERLERLLAEAAKPKASGTKRLPAAPQKQEP